MPMPRRLTGSRDVLAPDGERPGIGLLETRDHAQQGRLAAAAGPEQRQEMAMRHVDVHTVHGSDLPEALDDTTDAEVAHGLSCMGHRRFRVVARAMMVR